MNRGLGDCLVEEVQRLRTAIDGDLEPDALGEQSDLPAEEAHGVHVEVGVIVTHAMRAPIPNPWAETGDAVANTAPSARIDRKVWRTGAVDADRMAGTPP